MADRIKVVMLGERSMRLRLQEMPHRVWRRMQGTFTRLINRLSNEIRREISVAGLHRRSGNLARSVKPKPVQAVPQVSLTSGVFVGQGLPYAGVHEFGRTIRPQESQYLTIPIGRARTAKGVARFTARGAEAAGYQTFFARSKAGNLILFGRKGKGKLAKAVPLFLLRTSVDIHKRPYVRPAFLKWQTPFLDQMRAAVREGTA